MITLEATLLHWIKDDGKDDPSDLCAHSPVAFAIDGQTIVNPDDGDWTVSASAIFLLRALARDHTKDNPVGDQLFPCCGHGIYAVSESEVVICGCPNGINPEIRKNAGTYEVVTESGEKYVVADRKLRSAVLQYSEQVQKFYEESAPKEPKDDEDRKGFKSMMSEWKRNHAEQPLSTSVGKRKTSL